MYTFQNLDLDLNFCNQCSNSQLSVVVPPEKMFDNYFYLSSTSQQFRNHFIDIAEELKSDLKLNQDPMEETLSNPDKDISYMGINQRFGRKFRIVKFRWLNENDV